MSRTHWTPEQQALLVAHYPHSATTAVARLLGRSPRACYARAFEMGLKKSALYIQTHRAGYLDGIRGGKGRFKRGHETWNKGLKGLHIGGQATQFKPGHKPSSWRPIGHERVVDNGYRQRKITDTGVTRRDYVAVHHLVWREAGGEIPPGHVLLFRNGDKTDIRLDNLELITMAENMRRNTVHNLPKALAELVQLRGAITRKINRQQAEEEPCPTTSPS